MSKITTAMVLAAGLGTRMRPLTNDRPKALVEVGGKALIDHMLDRLAEAGVTRAVVNVHAFADLLEAHLAKRTHGPAIVISDERSEPLETGGGIKKAAALLGDDPIFVVNIDSVWIEDGKPALPCLEQTFDPDRMDICQLVAKREGVIGYDRAGDFFIDADGCVTMRGQAASAPYVQIGAHITKPRLVYDWPGATFGLFDLWVETAKRRRMHAVVLEGQWMHVGDPKARDDAEVRLAKAAETA